MYASSMPSTDAVLRDNEALKRRVEELLDEQHVLTEQSTQLLEKLAKEKTRVEALERELKRAFARFTGGSEKLDPAQLLLSYANADEGQIPPHANEAPDFEEVVEETPTSKKKKKKRKKRSRAGRQPLPDHLRRTRIVHAPSVADQTCACCGEARKQIGEDISEQLDYKPASLFVVQHVRPKFACPKCPDEGVLQESLPELVVEKGRPGAGLLAHIVTSKYADHLPLNRISEIYARFNVELARSTMCDWVRDAAFALHPIAEAIRRSVLSSRVVQTDDTRVRMQENWKKAGARNCRIWSYVGENDEVFYDFTLTREGSGPARILEDYRGYVQADAASTFDGLFVDGSRLEVGCWAHARRKFYEAMDFDPKECSLALALIQVLYKIEADGRGDPDKLQELRKTASSGALQSLNEHIDKVLERPTKKDPLSQAAQYARNHWDALCRYVDEPYLSIDNNACERSLRRVAVGRKNWLFAGSKDGGRRAATLYTIVESCRMQKVNVFEYVRDVLERVITHPSSRIDELIPRRWKPSAL